MCKNEIKSNEEKGFIVLSLKSLEHDIGDDKYELPKTPDSQYIVDDSSFIPMSEAVKQLGMNPNFASGGTFGQSFDFNDGKDNGSEIPIGRTKDGNDLAVISSAVADNNEKIQDSINAVKKDAEYKAKLNAELDNSRPKVTE